MNTEYWDERFNTDEYVFGTLPNAFLVREAGRLRRGMRALSVADGEGRNGVFLAERGLVVHAVEGSGKALAKARKLAAERGVGGMGGVRFEQADLLRWEYPIEAYDVVVGIFFQFAKSPEREVVMEGIKRAVMPGGLVMLQGYTPGQVGRGNGGPPEVEQMWTAELLRGWFKGWEMEHLEEHEEALDEGRRHRGMSAVVDMVARGVGAETQNSKGKTQNGAG